MHVSAWFLPEMDLSLRNPFTILTNLALKEKCSYVVNINGSKEMKKGSKNKANLIFSNAHH